VGEVLLERHWDVIDKRVKAQLVTQGAASSRFVGVFVGRMESEPHLSISRLYGMHGCSSGDSTLNYWSHGLVQ